MLASLPVRLADTDTKVSSLSVRAQVDPEGGITTRPEAGFAVALASRDKRGSRPTSRRTHKFRVSSRNCRSKRAGTTSVQELEQVGLAE